MVRIHASTTLRATPQRTAEKRRVLPTPTIAPVMVCVVLTGMPKVAEPSNAMARPEGAIDRGGRGPIDEADEDQHEERAQEEADERRDDDEADDLHQPRRQQHPEAGLRDPGACEARDERVRGAAREPVAPGD